MFRLAKLIVLTGAILILGQANIASASTEPRGFLVPDNFSGTADEGASLFETIITIVNALLAFAALVAAIVIAFSTFTALREGSGEDVAAAAKNTIIYASVGLIIILLSAVLVNFVIGTIV